MNLQYTSSNKITSNIIKYFKFVCAGKKKQAKIPLICESILRHLYDDDSGLLTL